MLCAVEVKPAPVPGRLTLSWDGLRTPDATEFEDINPSRTPFQAIMSRSKPNAPSRDLFHSRRYTEYDIPFGRLLINPLCHSLSCAAGRLRASSPLSGASPILGSGIDPSLLTPSSVSSLTP